VNPLATSGDCLQAIDTLPIFPLTGAVILPGTLLPLNVFESHYLAMMLDAMAVNRLVGMVQPNPTDSLTGLHRVGCVGRIVAFEEIEDERLSITLKGVCRFEIEQEIEHRNGYRLIRPNWSQFLDDMVGQSKQLVDKQALLTCVQRFVNAGKVTGDIERLDQLPDVQLTNLLAVSLPFSPDEKQLLLEANSPAARAEALLKISFFALSAQDDAPRH
jgi:Lon protease-like protein